MWNLKKAGLSRLVTVLIALEWWAGVQDQDPRWKAAVDSVRGCLESFSAVGSNRKASSDAGGRGKRMRTV
ncbi:hypothetical protein B0H34DRAFT_709676 [Crassisporium funariophilum]|nr:hypothetical protein B0H34DRAFT_709676 [Crassisporium funariophilum]